MHESPTLAKRVGFEPTELLHPAVFRTAAFSRSAISSYVPFTGLLIWNSQLQYNLYRR